MEPLRSTAMAGPVGALGTLAVAVIGREVGVVKLAPWLVDSLNWYEVAPVQPSSMVPNSSRIMVWAVPVPTTTDGGVAEPPPVPATSMSPPTQPDGAVAKLT